MRSARPLSGSAIEALSMEDITTWRSMSDCVVPWFATRSSASSRAKESVNGARSDWGIVRVPRFSPGARRVRSIGGRAGTGSGDRFSSASLAIWICQCGVCEVILSEKNFSATPVGKVRGDRLKRRPRGSRISSRPPFIVPPPRRPRLPKPSTNDLGRTGSRLRWDSCTVRFTSALSASRGSSAEPVRVGSGECCPEMVDALLPRMAGERVNGINDNGGVRSGG